jgi:hypothetical protein
MEEVRGKYVSPAIDELAFNCPHCDALARQFWFSVHADPLKSDEKPVVATAETGRPAQTDNGVEYVLLAAGSALSPALAGVVNQDDGLSRAPELKRKATGCRIKRAERLHRR